MAWGTMMIGLGRAPAQRAEGLDASMKTIFMTMETGKTIASQ